MPGESEYHQSYKPLEVSNEQLAGASSAKLAVTQEPAFARKRKATDHGRKVTFITDYTEHGAPLFKGPDKAMYFRAGLRRADTKVPTEYQLQYTWKEPVQESPLLSAENMLYHTSHHATGSDVHPEDDQGGAPFNNSNQNGNQDIGTQSSQQQQQQQQQQASVESTSGPGDHNAGRGNHHHCHLHENGSNHERAKKQLAKERELKQRKTEQTKSQPGVLNSGGDNHKKAAHHFHQAQKHLSKKLSQKKGHHSKKKKKVVATQFTTEYRSQFKGGKKERHKTSGMTGVSHPPGSVAGQPPVLTDQTDPRLLKHSPLPINKLFYLPSTKWGSEYSSNFMAPREFQFESGVWRGASQPDLLAQPVHHHHHQGSSEEGNSEPAIPPKSSWFNQLLELRKKADDYKKRAQTTHFLPHHLLALQHHEDGDILDSASTITSSTLTSSETPPSPTDTSSTVSEVHNAPRSFKQQQSSQRGKSGWVGASPVLKQRAVPNLSGAGGSMRVEDVEDFDTETVSSDSEQQIPHQAVVSTGHAQKKVYSQTKSKTTQNGVEMIPSYHHHNHRVGVSKLLPHGSPQGKGQSSDETQTTEGRVDTPRLVKSRSDHRRHHLDVTTPAGGGLLISPTKQPQSSSDQDQPPLPPSVQLPFPPTSPKFRKDMKSSAMIFPSPTQKKFHVVTGGDPVRLVEGGNRSKGKSVHVSSNVEGQREPTGMEYRNGTRTMGPRSIPVSSSPYHVQCASDPSQPPEIVPALKRSNHGSGHPTLVTDDSGAGPVRKLVFDGRKSQPHTQHPALSQLHQHKYHSSNVDNTCDTCGAHLRHSSTAPKHTGPPPPSQPQQTHKNTSQHQQHHHTKYTTSSLYTQNATRPSTTTISGGGISQSQHRPSTMSQSRPLVQRTHQGTTVHSSSGTFQPKFQSTVSRSQPKMMVQSLPSEDRVPNSGIGSSRRVMGDGGEGRGCEGVMSEPSDCADTLSLSSMSLSSCSVASEILKKARDRRDHFWARPRVAAT